MNPLPPPKEPFHDILPDLFQRICLSLNKIGGWYIKSLRLALAVVVCVFADPNALPAFVVPVGYASDPLPCSRSQGLEIGPTAPKSTTSTALDPWRW